MPPKGDGRPAVSRVLQHMPRYVQAMADTVHNICKVMTAPERHHARGDHALSQGGLSSNAQRETAMEGVMGEPGNTTLNGVRVHYSWGTVQ